VNIDGGFILKYGNIEINSSFDALFEENEEELVDIVNKMLWA
jgi:V/A-type H+-transporting ATPase subunit E